MRRFLAAALVFLACPGLYPLGSGEKKHPEYTATITGIIRLVGNAPFTRLVVSADDGKTYVIEDA